MSELLKNKVSIVTGGGSGIGKSIASIFAANKAKVNLFDINEEQGKNTCDEINKFGGNAEFIYCNIADPVSAKNAVDQVLNSEERIDILVNNAGISHVGNIEQTTSEDMDKLFNVNVKGNVSRNKRNHSPNGKKRRRCNTKLSINCCKGWNCRTLCIHNDKGCSAFNDIINCERLY